MQTFFLILLAIFFFTTNALAINNTSYQNEYDITIQHLIQNLNYPNNMDNTDNGVVIAALSKQNPDYYKHWVRDAGLVMGALIDLKIYKSQPLIKKKIKDWIQFEAYLQKQSHNGVGLGEPVFLVNGDVYPKPWGRPQNDGPAIRALAMMKWLDHLIEINEPVQARQLYLEIIEQDILFTADHWREESVDLWEEVRGYHYFTRVMQFKALDEAKKWSKKFSPTHFNKINNEAKQALDSLNSFYDLHNFNIITTLYPYLDQNFLSPKQENIDIANLLANIYFSHNDLPLDSPILIASMNRLETRFKEVYQINSKFPDLVPALGRYPEDIYDGVGFSGGNPWFLSTFAAAEYYCRLAPIVKGKKYIDRGLTFINRALFHAGPDRRLSEQYDRNSGYKRGAQDLTWSYIAYIRALKYCAKVKGNPIKGSH